MITKCGNHHLGCWPFEQRDLTLVAPEVTLVVHTAFGEQRLKYVEEVHHLADRSFPRHLPPAGDRWFMG